MRSTLQNVSSNKKYRTANAADFRDRIVHHLIVNKINHLFEKEFIHDSYACRTGRSTHFGINPVDRFIRRETANYAREAYVLKLDIKGFFMSIDRRLLFSRLERFLKERYHASDRTLVTELCRKTIYAEPARNCFIRGRKSDWDGLPPDKSLFTARKGLWSPHWKSHQSSIRQLLPQPAGPLHQTHPRDTLVRPLRG